VIKKTLARNVAIPGFTRYIMCHDSGLVYTVKNGKKHKPLTITAGYKVRLQRDTDGKRVSCDARELYRSTYEKWGPFGVSEETAEADRQAAYVIINDDHPVPDAAKDQAVKAKIYGVPVKVKETGQTGMVCGVLNARTWSVYIKLDIPVVVRTTSTTCYEQSIFVYRTHQLEEV